jgi:hypothetical protein
MRKTLIGTALVLAVSAFSGCVGGSEGESSAGGARGGEAAVTAPPVVDEASGGGGELAVGEDSSGPLTLPGIGSRVVQTASVELSVPAGGFDRAVSRARTIATGLGGFVVSSSASQGAAHRLVAGSLVVRVPERSYAEAMNALTDLGRVEAREESGHDVSQEFVDLEARRRHLEAVENQLLQLLNKATTVEAALAVQSRLADVQLELEQVRGRIDYLDDQVSFATISLDLSERGAVPVAEKDGWGIVDAWETAAHGFTTVVAWIFVGVATALPLLILAALAYAVWRYGSRRHIDTADA